MSRVPTGGNAGDLARLIDRRPFESPIGLRMLVPGWPHLCWSQRARGWVFLGSFAISLFVGLWTWGTWQSWGILAFTFITHVASATDVLRQRSFPIDPRWTALVVVAGSLGLFIYLPAFFVLSLFAWPGFEPDGTGNGFLIDLCAYRGSEPRQGHWIWMRPPPYGEPRAAQVVAVSGQEVEWSGRSWKIDGQDRSLTAHLRLTAWPQACRFKVPANQVLVEPQDDGVSTPQLGPLVLVSPDRIIGRAWAQFYPVWDRRLL
ncbi:MAG: hypothetical protein ACHRXM_33500 [Isosphaerales bacterium]